MRKALSQPANRREARGLFVVLLGPDGVGKSSILESVATQAGQFTSTRVIFHWRPMTLFRPRSSGSVSNPHGKPVRGSLGSVVHLLCHLLDYWAGYWLSIRPVLKRNALVIFDRYFYDLLADPRRYQYGGPRWLVRVVELFIPRPDLVLVLDAREDTVFSRKQELCRDEIRRQRAAYQQLAYRLSRAELVVCEDPLDTVVERIMRIIGPLIRGHRAQHSSETYETAAVR